MRLKLNELRQSYELWCHSKCDFSVMNEKNMEIKRKVKIIASVIVFMN